MPAIHSDDGGCHFAFSLRRVVVPSSLRQPATRPWRCCTTTSRGITSPAGFDVVHARWLIERLPDKRLALQRMVAATRPGGVVLVEEPDFVTIYGAGEPAALRRAVLAAMRHLEATDPVEVEYGRRAPGDLIAVGLRDTQAEGRCPIVRSGHPLAAHFLRFTLEKLRKSVVSEGEVTESEFAEALDVLENPAVTVVTPMTVAAWARRA